MPEENNDSLFHSEPSVPQQMVMEPHQEPPVPQQNTNLSPDPNNPYLNPFVNPNIPYVNPNNLYGNPNNLYPNPNIPNNVLYPFHLNIQPSFTNLIQTNFFYPIYVPISPIVFPYNISPTTFQNQAANFQNQAANFQNQAVNFQNQAANFQNQGENLPNQTNDLSGNI